MYDAREDAKMILWSSLITLIAGVLGVVYTLVVGCSMAYTIIIMIGIFVSLFAGVVMLKQISSKTAVKIVDTNDNLTND